MISDVQQFNKTLKDLLEYYRKPANTTVTGIWLTACSEAMDDELFNQAVIVCLRERSQLPTINEFIGLVCGDEGVLQQLSNADAWTQILEGAAIASSKREEHVSRREEIVKNLSLAQSKALYELGGFDRLGLVPSDDMVWRRKEFMQLCKIYSEGDKERGKGARFFLSRTTNSGLTSLAESIF